MAIKQVNGKWLSEFMYRGQRYKKRFDTQEQAEKWTAEVKQKQDDTGERGDGEVKAHSVGHLAQVLFNVKWKNTSYEAHRDAHRREITEYFGADSDITTVTLVKCEDYVAKLIDNGLSASTINKKVQFINRLVKNAYDKGLLPKLFKLDSRKSSTISPRYLLEEEERLYLATFKGWGDIINHDNCRLMLDTGLRPITLFALTFRSHNPEAKALEIPAELTKTKSNLSIPLTEASNDVILKRRKEAKSVDEKVIPNTYDSFYRKWVRVTEHLGLNEKVYTPYIMRHTCASKLVQNGVALTEVQKWLDHTTPTTTMRYAHLYVPDSMSRMRDILEVATIKAR